CADFFDNDFDGLVDCADSDCVGDPVCPAQVCGDFIVEFPEVCEPPNSATCDANCQLAPESICSNLIDEDFDDLTDCEGPTDCGNGGQCVPGTTIPGGACTSQLDCTANNNDPFCIQEGEFGFPGGGCSEFCDQIAQDCGANDICFDVGLPSGNG